jgi:glutathione-regulated potassium-efflux system ancillary protein KefC
LARSPQVSLDIDWSDQDKIVAVNVHSFLVVLVVLLTVLTLATSVFQQLRLGSVIGMIVAGITLGPWGLHLVHDVDRLRNFTELAIVLLMFTIGLEMAPQKLWTMRRLVFGLGSAQVLGTGGCIILLLIAKDFPWRGAVLGGLGLALSSTAFGVQILQERKETATPYGEASFAILLAQDLAIVPLLALIPLLSPNRDVTSASSLPVQFLEVMAAFVIVFATGRYLLPFLLRILDLQKNTHGFVALVFLTIFGAALVMEWAGLSMALGAFFLGMLLSGSEFKHRVEQIVSPLKSALLDMFFISVGMSMNLKILGQEGWRMILHVIAIVVVKTMVLYLLARLFRFDRSASMRIGALLSNAGEFGFVLFGAALAAGIVTENGFNLAALTISISMAMTPLMVKFADAICKTSAFKNREERKGA